MKIYRTLPLETAALFGCAVMIGVGVVVNTAVEVGTSVAGSGGAAWGLIQPGRAGRWRIPYCRSRSADLSWRSRSRSAQPTRSMHRIAIWSRQSKTSHMVVRTTPLKASAASRCWCRRIRPRGVAARPSRSGCRTRASSSRSQPSAWSSRTHGQRVIYGLGRPMARYPALYCALPSRSAAGWTSC